MLHHGTEQRKEWNAFYESDGCHLFHKCLECPFSVCFYDDEEKVTAEALAMGIVPGEVKGDG